MVREAGSFEEASLGRNGANATHVVWSRLSGLSATLLFMVLVLGLLYPSRDMAQVSAAANPVDAAREMKVQPGDAQIERGSSLVVTATFEGLVPEYAEVRCEFDGG